MLETTIKAAFNGHSMVGTLERVLVCSPRTAGWNQSERVANWKVLGFQHEPNFAVAQSQHEALCRELEAAGVEVVEMPAALDLSSRRIRSAQPFISSRST